MPNPGILMLSQKLHLLQSQWDQPTATGQMLRQSLEVFQMEVGLSIFSEDYERLGHLSSHEWWKHLWQLCSRYKVSLTLSRKYITPLLREDDRSFMDDVCSTNMYTHDYQLAGQRVRRYKGLFSIGDFVLMDGRTDN
jgi:hypothetical protein